MKPYNTSLRLKQIMTDRNLKQVDILNMCKPYCDNHNIKLGKNDLSQYVNGKVEPGQEKLYVLSKALDVSEAWLMGYDVPMESNNKSYISKDSIAYRIITLMKWKKISMDELAKQTNSDVESLEDYIYNTPNSKFDENNDLLKKIVDALNTNNDTLFGFNKISDDTYENYISFLYDKLYNDEPMTDQENKTIANYINCGSSNHFLEPEISEDVVTFPVIGEIAAGYDSIALEDWSGETVEIPSSYLKGRNKEEFMVLSVKGDSMYPLYMAGDKVLILKQSTLNYSGEIGAVLYDDNNATLKKVEYVMGEDWMKLIPINPEYKPKKIVGEELEHCRIIGIPKLLIRDIDEYDY